MGRDRSGSKQQLQTTNILVVFSQEARIEGAREADGGRRAGGGMGGLVWFELVRNQIRPTVNELSTIKA